MKKRRYWSSGKISIVSRNASSNQRIDLGKNLLKAVATVYDNARLA